MSAFNPKLKKLLPYIVAVAVANCMFLYATYLDSGKIKLTLSHIVFGIAIPFLYFIYFLLGWDKRKK